MVRINGKDMEIWLKRGMGSQQISQELGIPYPDFFEILEKSFTSKAVKTFKRRLSKNDKTVEKSSDKPIQEEKVEKEKKEEKSEISIKKLLEMEKMQQAVTAAQEGEVKKTIQMYRKVCEAVTKKAEIADSLISQITELNKEISNLEENAIIALENHDKELNRLHEEQKKLNSIREEIARRSVINVYAYADGSITIESHSDPMEETFDGWKEKKETIEEKYESVVGELQLKQIKQLAKILSLPKLEENQKYEISFELSEMETIYLKLIAEEE